MRALLITLAIASVAAQCDRWAAAGECTRNPEYMRVRCADECAQAANAPASSPLLVYTKSACAAWAAAGECTHNRIFMSQSCSAACQCESWASAGECTRLAHSCLKVAPTHAPDRLHYLHNRRLPSSLIASSGLLWASARRMLRS